MAIDLVLRPVLRWINSTVACGSCIKHNEMGIWKMNERIRELAKQAGCPIDFFGYGEGHIEGLAELLIEKFDDILVLEYVDCIGNKDKQAEERVQRLREKVKTYFGVE